MRPVLWLLPMWVLFALAFGCEGGPHFGVFLGLPCTRIDPAEPPDVVEARLHARLEAARAMSSPFEKDEALEKIARDAAGAGLDELTREALIGIRNPFDRNETAGRCAGLLARAGRGAAAVEVARTISNSFERDEVLKKLATSNE